MEALLPLEHFTMLIAQLVARLAELSAAIIIAIAVLEALWRVFLMLWRCDKVLDEQKENLRLALGRWLAIALEFLLAADIVLTAITPTWQDIGKLGAVAMIRTILNYFLRQEINDQAQRHAKSSENNAL